MTRSLWVSDKYLEKVRLNLRRNFPNQKALSEAVGLAPATVNNFFTGKPIDRLNFEEICDQLGLQWREVADLDNPRSPTDSQLPKLNFYVERVPYETQCYEAIKQPGALIRIKAPLQMGKTLLMSRILQHAARHGYRTVALNLRDATLGDFSSLDKFLQWFCTSIAVMLGLTQPVDEHWSRSLGNSKIKCRTYFEKYLLPGGTTLAIALDEVDRVFPHWKIAGEFLGMLRTWHEDAKTRELWRQIRLLVLHTEVYTQLDINQSPFNAGKEIKLTDLSLGQVQDLARQYGLNWDNDQVKQLMDMVGGHPCLVSKALEQVAQQYMTLEQLLQSASDEAGIYRDHLRRHLRDLKQHPQLDAALKKLVIADDPVAFNSELNSDIAVKLDDLGMVKLQSNTAMPRYKLYRQYFRNRLENDT